LTKIFKGVVHFEEHVSRVVEVLFTQHKKV